MNCKKVVEQTEARLFQQVFVCPSCFLIAERMLEVAARELKKAHGILRDTVRYAILNGSLQFKTKEQIDNATSPELLRELADLVQNAMESSQCPEKTPSLASMSPHVRTLAAVGRSSSKTSNQLDSSSAVQSQKDRNQPSDSAENVSGTTRSS